jgi:hypothetical protein
MIFLFILNIIFTIIFNTMSKCEHGKRKSRCVVCGGSEICPHLRIKYNCKDCKGSNICEHNKNKIYCHECNGSAFCIHDKRKDRCLECGGSNICEHGKRKERCIKCGGSELCCHNILKSTCKQCQGGSICEHNHIRTSCKECGGGAICEHNKRRSECKECGGSQICIHKISKHICKLCRGNQICIHDKVYAQCIECKGGSICIHDKLKRRCKICDGKDLCKTHLCETRVGNKYDGYCLRCFSHIFPEKPIVKNFKTKEREVIQFIKQEFPDFTWTFDKKVSDGCSLYRPDAIVDLGYNILIIEIDENQHKAYDEICENKRMMQISKDLQHRPIVFIRFNPDEYIKENQKISSCWGTNKKGDFGIKPTKKKEWNQRLTLLKETITFWKEESNVSSKMVEIISLFFDDVNYDSD